MKLDHQKFIGLYKGQYGALNDNQSSGMDKLLGFLEQDKDVGDVRWAAYMLATVKEECADTWQPIEEYGKGQGYPYGNPVPVKGSDGKTYVNTYYGRGYVQITGEDNYQKMGQNLNLGDQILIQPERALDPPISYDIMSFGMRNGSFTGVGLETYINGSQCDYVNARRIVNGVDRADLIAGYAKTLESLLRESFAGGETGPRQYHIVNAPDGVNARKGPGSNFPVVHGIANNSQIDIVCQVHGEVVNGSNIWNKLSDGTFVTDVYCDTSNFNAFSPPLPVCKDAPQPPASPAIRGDDYPYKDSTPDDLRGDPWAFLYRECTSFVAWRMNQLGAKFSNGMSGPNSAHGWFGNADTWATNARNIGFRVDNTPSVGAIAHFGPNVSGAGSSGHVAYVAQVNGDGTIAIEEYNWLPFRYGYHSPPRVIRASDVSDFIHIV